MKISIKMLMLVSMSWSDPAFAQPVAERSLPLEGYSSEAERSVTLSWRSADSPLTGTVRIYRRRLGESGASTWKLLDTPKSTSVWRDINIPLGVAFEYQVVRHRNSTLETGYWTAGIGVLGQAKKGLALLVIDDEIAEGIPTHLARFRSDLVGAGWTVVDRLVPRHRRANASANLQAGIEIRRWIRRKVSEDPFGENALIIIGNAPVLLSGYVAPDGHNARPHPTDAFYADMDGKWSGSSEGLLYNNSVPSNGIEVQVGRIDFAGLAGRDRELEIRLLQQYFDKNHHWRHGYLGDPRIAYWGDDRLEIEKNELFNVVDSTSISRGGHNDSSEKLYWLWGIDFGSWRFEDYFEDTGGKVRSSIFAINFGSNKQLFDAPKNSMVALLAQPWATLAVGWGGRPAWRLHLMGLGASIGEVHRRTINNGTLDGTYPDDFEYFPTGNYVFRQPVWVNLLGDPTLSAYPLNPPTNPILQNTGDDGPTLAWDTTADSATTLYSIFRMVEDGSRVEPVEGGALIDSNSFRVNRTTDTFLVRSYDLKQTPAGSFYTFSQGAYSTSPNKTLSQIVKIRAGKSGRIKIPSELQIDGQRLLLSVVRPPNIGDIKPISGGWEYFPPPSTNGSVVIPVSIYNGSVSRRASLEIQLN